MTEDWLEGWAEDLEVSDAVDTTVAHQARIYDYWLGGKDNFAADREAADQAVAAYPPILRGVRAQRAFLARAVGYLAAEAGVRQFLDIGTGIPTANNTHEVAQAADPGARVVYVDNDPMVLAHARALLTSTKEGATAYIHADLDEPDKIMAEAAKTLDFGQPIALILSGVLGHVTDTGQARSIAHRLMDALPSGSYLSLNDGTSVIGGEEHEQATEDYNQTGAVPYVQRSPQEIASFFDGLELVEPGVVSCPLWRPEASEDGPPAAVDAFGGVGRKP